MGQAAAGCGPALPPCVSRCRRCSGRPEGGRRSCRCGRARSRSRGSSVRRRAGRCRGTALRSRCSRRRFFAGFGEAGVMDGIGNAAPHALLERVQHARGVDHHQRDVDVACRQVADRGPAAASADFLVGRVDRIDLARRRGMQRQILVQPASLADSRGDAPTTAMPRGLMKRVRSAKGFMPGSPWAASAWRNRLAPRLRRALVDGFAPEHHLVLAGAVVDGPFGHRYAHEDRIADEGRLRKAAMQIDQRQHGLQAAVAAGLEVVRPDSTDSTSRPWAMRCPKGDALRRIRGRRAAG